MQPGDLTDIPPDLGAAIHMIGRLRAEIKRRPRLTVMSVDPPDDVFHADTLNLVEQGQKVTITLETDPYTFRFTAFANGIVQSIQSRG